MPQQSTPTFAVPLFDAKRLKRGNEVIVNDSGVQLHGHVALSAPDRLVVGTTEFHPGRGVVVTKIGDPIWDGAALGFMLGLAAGAGNSEGCLNHSRGSCMLSGGLALGGLGALIDWVHDGHEIVYDGGTAKSARLSKVARSIVPIAGPGVLGAAMVLAY
jgi:hypothetical protein